MSEPTPDEAPLSVDAVRKRGGWIRQRIDYPTIFIGFSGFALWMLWPELPAVDSDRIPRRRALVVARQGSKAVGEWYKRPDLIAFPSLVSFAPMSAGDEATVGVAYHSDGASRLLERIDDTGGEVAAPSAVALAAEAAREISSARAPYLRERWSGLPMPPAAPVHVVTSAGLGHVAPQWSEADKAVLFTMGRAWEVELSLTIADDGQPERVFLEKGCGDAAIDRAVMRTLSRPDVWKGATGGSGTVLVSYSPPRAANGDRHED